MKQTYIHFHNGRPRYVGEGSRRRPTDFYHRSPDWWKYFAQFDDPHICVLVTSIHHDEVGSVLQEQGLISWIGKENLLNNESFRGQGRQFTDKQKKECRERMLNPSDEWRQAHRQGCLTRVYDEKALSKALSKAALERIERNPENFQRFLEAGQTSRKGSTHTKETIQRMKESALKRERKTCVHCGKTCAVNTFARFHGDNCKHKL